jgi:hypothetical protein
LFLVKNTLCQAEQNRANLIPPINWVKITVTGHLGTSAHHFGAASGRPGDMRAVTIRADSRWLRIWRCADVMPEQGFDDHRVFFE